MTTASLSYEQMQIRWEALWERVQHAAQAAGRAAHEVRVLPVSKKHSAEALIRFLKIPGVPARLGESYAQELFHKQQSLEGVHPPVEWHFVGRIQSRTLARIAGSVECIHTVCRPKELDILGGLRSSCPRFFFQVNVSGEGQKGGCTPEELAGLKEQTQERGLIGKVAGLMCLPTAPETASEREVRKQFVRLRELRDRWFPGGELSMGMSQDFEWAIAEGSHWVRIGSLLFGERD